MRNLNIYGYFSTRYEKVYDEPSLDDDGHTINVDSPGEWAYPYFHLMMQQLISSKYKIFVNINGDGGGTLDLRNMWGEITFNQYAHIRIGKMYRQFGLYNEILDAVPTYIGIEPPELFDNDHLILSRTTNLMLFGEGLRTPA